LASGRGPLHAAWHRGARHTSSPERMFIMADLRLATLLAALVGCLSAPAWAQSIDQGFYYKLSTQFRGNGMKLDVFNGGPRNNMTRLEPDQDVSGQFWRFAGNADGTFRLSTLLRGPGMCLDVFNGGPNDNQPHLADCDDLSGQAWRIVLAGDGELVHLTTEFHGPGICLDIFNEGPTDNQPYLAECNDVVSSQFWMLTKTDKRAEE
jgi:hypothetical protein